MADLDEQAIHRQLLNGDPAGLEQLIDLLGHKAYRLAQLVMGGTGTEQDLEEIVSDALAAAWSRATEFDPARSTLTNWVLILTKYAALDRRRAIKRRTLGEDGLARVIPLTAAPEPTSPNNEEILLRAEQRSEVHQALARLPEGERELLIRRYLFEEPLAEMAEELGLTRGALDTRLWRARQSLKRVLESESEVCAHDR